MTKSKKRLGTDLGALLGISNENLEDGSFVNEVDNLTELPIELLQPGKYQPRSVISDEKIAELSESIKQHGIMQPLVVRKLDLESYEIMPSLVGSEMCIRDSTKPWASSLFIR